MARSVCLDIMEGVESMESKSKKLTYASGQSFDLDNIESEELPTKLSKKDSKP